MNVSKVWLIFRISVTLTTTYHGKYWKLSQGIANVGPDSDGFLFIGVADKESDAKKIESLIILSCLHI